MDQVRELVRRMALDLDLVAVDGPPTMPAVRCFRMLAPNFVVCRGPSDSIVIGFWSHLERRGLA